MGRMPDEHPSTEDHCIVYQPDQWDALAAQPKALQRLCDWLTANGIIPNVVPTLTPIAVEQRRDGTRMIRHHVYRTDHLGQKMVDPQRPQYAATVECAVPLAVDWQGPLLPDTDRTAETAPPADADDAQDAAHERTVAEPRPASRGAMEGLVIPVQPYRDFAPAPDTPGAGHTSREA